MQLDLIPGTMCDERVWSRVLPYLPEFSANYISLAGRQDRESIRRTLLEKTAQKANLIGFSMGGYLALEHALSHPERVNSLIIIAASARGLTEQEKLRRHQVLEHLRERSYTGMPMVQILSLLGAQAHGDAEAITLMREMDRDLGKETLLSQLSATMDRPDRMDDLKTLPCPVLIVGGRQDTLARVEELERMNQAVAGSRLEVLECGHMIPLEAPQLLGQGISAFLHGI